MSTPTMMREGLRWFGPNDPIPLAYLLQAGASDVFNSLHEISYGEVWTQNAIRTRKELIAQSGLTWSAVESVAVHEDIKTGNGELNTLFSNYIQTLQNLAEEGINLVIYNFMPVLDWVRTDMHWALPDGSRCLRFNPIHFAAFEVFSLNRKGAESDYTTQQLAAAEAWWHPLSPQEREKFIQSIIDVFPGVKWGLSLDDIRKMLSRYKQIDANALRANLARFLETIIPVAEEIGIRMAIHPDDPPFSILGLPRIVSTQDDIQTIFKMVDSQANGLCFCSGSFSAHPDNDLPKIARTFGSRIHAAHLRSTHREADGSFYEAHHLGGSVDMPAVVSELLHEQDLRQAAGRSDWQILLRPDHGHVMMDDLDKAEYVTPGYPAIGRMRGLAELRGLMHGLRHAQSEI